MRRSLRVCSTVLVSMAAGMSIGLLPTMLRDSRAARQDDRGKHNFRSRFSRVVARSVDPKIVKVTGIFEVGDAAPYDEARVQQLRVFNGRGDVIVDRELGRVEIAAGEHSGQFPIDEHIELPAGRYQIHVLSYVPGTSHVEDGVRGPLIGSRSIRTVDVK
jgi:hypothetical protein